MSAIHAVAAAFYPSNSVMVAISGRTVSDVANGAALAGYEIHNNGTVLNQNLSVMENWLIGGSVGDYDVRATKISGSPSGVFDTWLTCSSTHTWTLSNAARNNSVKTASMLIEIRLAASPNTVLTSATISLEAESDNLN